MENKRQCVMMVDDNMTNLAIGKNMLKEYYELYAVPSAAKLFELLRHKTPDLILLDIEMPEMDGYEAIRQLKSNSDTVDIPVIFLTAKSDENSELEGLKLGAIDYVSKPFSAPLLQRRIETHILMARQKRQLSDQAEDLKRYANNLHEIVKVKTAQVVNLQNSVLSTVAELVEFRDDVTGGHILRTQEYLRLLVERLAETGVYGEEMAEWDMDYLLASAPLHDVGKIAISDLILNKPGKLTTDEFDVMKTHTTIGVELIERIETTVGNHSFLKHAKNIAGAHHERWDGLGYPMGLSGAGIPLEARLMAISDVYDAMISARPYKTAKPPNVAAAEIAEGRGTHFDPLLVDAFSSIADRFAAVAEHSGALAA